MAKINKKKQRRNLMILGIAFLLFIFCVSFIINMISAFFQTDTVAKKEEKIEQVQLSKIDYKKMHINESGNIPVMMYHGIHDIKSAETGYTGGNVDVDGYQRTAEAFRKDLDFYYKNGYRMVRLEDYVDGDIKCDVGKTPLVLTFDDGLDNNIFVTGRDSKGNIKIDPNSAIGILEEYKKKYPDFNVTATFFVNGGLFNQPEYNEDILHWLVDHGYDVGNHTYTHIDFTMATPDQSSEEVGLIYNMLDQIIPNRYVNIVALPFGSPYVFNHENMPFIIDSNYNGKEYHTKTTLQVAWEADYSPYNVNFNPYFIKRIRAYDNEGTNFDIRFNFDVLEQTRYISDGDENTIVIPEKYKELIGNSYGKKVVTYS